MKYKTKNKRTEQEYRDAINTSDSIHQALIKLGVIPQGGNYRVINNAVKEFNIDTSHFTGMLWSKGKTIGPKRPIEDYLSNRHRMTSSKLRQRLVKEGIKQAQCEKCHITHWNDLPAPLELDHIDGDHQNNSLDNLRILCANCHSQTPTFRRKK